MKFSDEPKGEGRGGVGGRAGPAVSVVMPVRNARPFLDEAVRSVLGQTFRDFELVVLDDASEDGSAEILREWARRDARVRLVESRRPLGLSGSSEAVVREARAPLVARMDADDVAHPERLARQLEVMRARPEVVLVGSLCEGIDAAGRRVRPRDRWRLVRASLYPPFPHGSAMFRREAFEAVGGYREDCAGWEDQDLFLRLSRRGRVVVLPETLYFYRYHVSNSTGGSPVEHRARLYGVRQLCFAEFSAGRDYAGVLREAARLNGDAPRADADALYQTGAMRLWAGHPPDILADALRPGTLGLSSRSLLTLALAVWGRVSPASLRLSLRSFIRARDLLAGWRVKDGSPREWRLK
jgi:glycosyltransferase involved in cell wall biosynthesis